MEVTPEAGRATRAILKWSIGDLAERAGVVWTTTSRLEAGAAGRDATAAQLVGSFAAEGVELVVEAERTEAMLIYARRRSPADNG